MFVALVCATVKINSLYGWPSNMDVARNLGKPRNANLTNSSDLMHGTKHKHTKKLLKKAETISAATWQLCPCHSIWCWRISQWISLHKDAASEEVRSKKQELGSSIWGQSLALSLSYLSSSYKAYDCDCCCDRKASATVSIQSPHFCFMQVFHAYNLATATATATTTTTTTTTRVGTLNLSAARNSSSMDS